MTLREIPRLERPEPQRVYREYVKEGRPVLVSGALADWPALERWTPEYLRDRFPDVQVFMAKRPDLATTHEPTSYMRERRFYSTTMAKFVERLLGGEEQFYLSQWNPFSTVPEFGDDLGSLSAYVAAPGQELPRLRRHVWFGPRDAYTPLHFDPEDNLFVQLYGEKEFLIYAPEDARNVYYPWLNGGLVNYSPVNVESPDLARYPRFQRAHPYRLIVRAGDLLYLPPRWWHRVVSRSTSISVSYWWVHDALRFHLNGIRDRALALWSVHVLRHEPLRRSSRPVEPLD